nr:hypothetical protein CPGR_00515 [Mycolicibacterium fortuitum subsp. fortuitum DSM 46621 = ATCC 6841 = JCM 6387]CRL82854.1 hypothetical protein CPGR_06081 [Mycolicibacter nonchromogenicus]
MKGNRIVRVAAVPAAEVVAELDLVEVRVVELVVDALPLVDDVSVVVGGAGLLESDVADQMIDTGAAPMHGRGRAGDLRAGQQGVLDLAQFQALPTQLDLCVGASEVFQAARFGPAHQVTGAIQPRPRSPERVGHEAIRSQIGTTDITTGHGRSGQVQLAHHPDGSRVQACIENVGIRTRNRSTDTHRPADRQRTPGGPDRHLGRPIRIEHPPRCLISRLTRGGSPRSHQLSRARLATGHQRVQPIDLGWVQRRQNRRRDQSCIDALARQHLGQCVTGVGVRRGYHQCRARRCRP